MKITASVTKNSHQYRGPCYLHLGEGSLVFCCTVPTVPNNNNNTQNNTQNNNNDTHFI